MAKTIKFNLICNGETVRTIEDLQNNFYVEDILDYYNNGLLHRWLGIRGYEDKLAAVNSISVTQPLEIIKELVEIFEIEADMEEIEKSVYILEYLDERKNSFEKYVDTNSNVRSVVDQYFEGYKKLMGDMARNPSDAPKLKAIIAEMVTDYSKLLLLYHRELFYRLKGAGHVLTIMCFLMNEKTRKLFLPGDGEDLTKNLAAEDKAKMYADICRIVSASDFKELLGDNLKSASFSAMADENWIGVEPKGKKYMIISMETESHVRPAGDRDYDFESKDVKNKFLIVDGIDYKSNSSLRQLFYMEV